MATFKRGQPVLVKDSHGPWERAEYMYEINGLHRCVINPDRELCRSSAWKDVIPLSGNEHLIGRYDSPSA